MDYRTDSPPGSAASGTAASPRWPRVVGTIGIVLGIIIFIDQIDDLWMQLAWTEDEWRRFFSADVARIIMLTSGPKSWQIASGVLQMGLGVFLVVASLRLRGSRPSGDRLCRAWAWLAILWALVETGWALVVLSRYAGDFPGIPESGWRGFALFGIVFALALMVAFPTFLLVWLSRPEVRAEVERWSE